MSTLIVKFKPLMPKVKSLMPKVKPLLTLAVGFLAALGVLSLTHTGPAQAQSPGVNLAALVAQVNTLKAQVATLQGRATVLETKTAPLSVSGTPGTFPATLSITGVNVQVVSGSGSTNDGGTLSGLGNLIIGYNALGNNRGAGDVRTGSHNLILGDFNSYSSFGGLVAGFDNAISGQYASISGGFFNTASGNTASVSGGFFNAASGDYASVSGGIGLTQSNNNGWTGGVYHSP